MTLTPGTRLGPYEIVSSLGAGGMGEVYRARDTRLDRTVAVKVLPTDSASDPAFRERFDREARLISSLSHPHICALFDVGRQDPSTHSASSGQAGAGQAIDFLVIEYLEGETLAARLEKGPLRLDLALQIAVQVAGALDAAHRAGVVHRDVKPGNVMLTRAGAKLLDFGLARHGPAGGVMPGVSMLPTTPGVTAQGTILGTLQYMSPEQLEGSEADSRSDIFSFGALVYEMVTGRRAFEGKSQASLITSIMSSDPPPVASLAPMVPSSLDRVVRKCLSKDPDDRWQSAKDLHDELVWVANAGAAVEASSDALRPVPVRARGGRLPWAVAALLGALTLATALLGRAGYLSPSPVQAPMYRTSLILPAEALSEAGLGRRFAISPDGRSLVFVALSADRTRMLWLRPLDSLTAQRLPGTEGANGPFWSPDSRFVGFVAQGRLKKVDISGGPPTTVAPEAVDLGGSWNQDDVILFVPKVGALYQVRAAGGTPTSATAVDGTARHTDPFFLPDGRHFLYQVTESNPKRDISGVYVGSLDSQETPVRLLRANSNPLYSQGHLLFTQERTLMAVPFDADRLNTTGDAIPVSENVGTSGLNAASAISVSATGALVYRTGSAALRTQLTWFDRKGVRGQTVGEAADQMAVELSPDGTRLAVSSLDTTRDTRDVWMHDLTRGLRTRFTFDAADDIHTVWSSDGSQVAFDSRRSGRLGLFLKPASGAGADTTLLESDRDNLYAVSLSRDGRYLSYFTGNTASPTGSDIWVLPLTGDRPSTGSGRPEPAEGRKPIPFMQTQFNERYGRFSPDGRWIAYASTESGRDEVYVAPFPGPAVKWQVSSNGGAWPRWRGDGRELFYEDAEGRLMAASVDGSGAALVVGAVQPLFTLRMRTAAWAGSTSYNYDVTADGQRFLVNTADESQGDAPITLLLNWAGNLR
jgi:Tol biopolymer transport system component